MFEPRSEINRYPLTEEMVRTLQCVWPDFTPINYDDEELDAIVLMARGWRC